MRDIPDEDLDDLFKQAAFYHRPPDTANEGWTAMQKKLNDNWIKIIYQRVKIFVVIELALLACIFFLLQNNGAFKSSNKVALSKKSNTEINSQILNDKKNKETNHSSHIESNVENEFSMSEKKIETSEIYKGSDNKNELKEEKESRNEKGIKENNVLNNTKMEKILIHKNMNGDYKTSSSLKPTLYPNSKQIIEPKKQNDLWKTDDKNDSSFPIKSLNEPNLTKVNIGLLKIKGLPDRKETIATMDKTLEIKNDSIPVLAKERNKDYKFNVTFIIAPDLSFTGLRNLNSVGSNMGILLGYSLSKRFTINTGLIYSTKVYSAKPSDYHPANNY